MAAVPTSTGWGTWGPIIAGAGIAGTTAALQNRQSNKNRQAQQEEAALDRSAAAGRNTADVALEESMADPFRHQLGQARTLAALDLIARGRNTPTKISVPAGMEQWVPKISGGFSYDMNPDVRAAAQRLQQDVASGRTAPTMTDPANYGKTAVLNLRNPSAAPGAGAPGGTMPGTGAGGGGGTAVPRAGSAAATSTSLADDDFMSSVFGADAGSEAYSTDPKDAQMNATSPYYQNYRRRQEGAGGVISNAVKYGQTGATVGSVVPGIGTALGAVGGFIGGAVGGAFTKNAKSAMSDFYAGDARKILKEVTRTELGREFPDEAIDEMLRGQGLQAGGKWAGQQGLDYIIQQIRNSPEAQQRRQQRQQPQQLTPSYDGLFA